MLKINNIKYTKYDTNIHWKNFERTHNKIKEKGIAPFLKFNIENKILIGLEFVYSKENWQNIPIDTKVNLNKYLIDITYEDNKGWISIITGTYNCTTTRISDTEYKLDLLIKEEYEEINITINTKITLF